MYETRNGLFESFYQTEITISFLKGRGTMCPININSEIRYARFETVREQE